MTNLPLVRVNSLLPLLKFFKENSISLDDFLHKSTIPENIFSQPEKLLSLYQVFNSIDSFAYRQGIDFLGILASEKLEIEHLGLFGKVLRQSLTGYDLLRTIVTLLKKTYSSGVKVWLTEDDDRIWFNHQYPNFSYNGNKQKQGNYYAFFLHFRALKTILNFDWYPTDLYFRGETVKGLSDLGLFSQSRLHFNKSYNSIAISKNLLYLPLKKESENINHNEEQNLYEQLISTSPPVDFSKALQQLIRSQLFGGSIKIETIADSIGMSSRSLQRCLGDRDLSYSRLLDQVRFQLAVQWLQDNSISVSEIAFELQYNEINSFRRSFKRWTGVTPSEYRNRLYRGE
ncbi:helix-turn-helix transcriptional regulator [Geminocystis sp. CENA526]|uniref:helix-turn-helix transcriptional regulator n=1 Tax=Geminocystis sp. CENA526 TaxID=1355871 RepID=UPI003D6F373F